MIRPVSLTLAGLLLATAAVGQTFSRHARWLGVGPNPCAVIAHDFNGDGYPEIATADRGEMIDPGEERPANDEVSFLVSTGPLEYRRPRQTLRTGFGPWCLGVANMDALGTPPDLVVGCFHEPRSPHLSLFLAMEFEEGAAEVPFKPVEFAANTLPLPYARHRDLDDRPVFTTPGITALAVRDFDGDTYQDVVAAGWSSDVLLYFAGVEDESLQAPEAIRAPGGPRDLAAGDIDEDGDLDLVVTMYTSGEVTVWDGVETGRFEESARFLSRGRLPHACALDDIDGDGHLDIAVSHAHSADSLAIFYGDGDGGFPVSQLLELGDDPEAVEHDLRDLVAADLDGDGRVDLAAACAGPSSQVLVFLNASDGPGPQEFSTERYRYDPDEASPHALCVADLNNNGKQDLAVALWKANAVALLLGR
jgi:hypothetical protein